MVLQKNCLACFHIFKVQQVENVYGFQMNNLQQLFQLVCNNNVIEITQKPVRTKFVFKTTELNLQLDYLIILSFHNPINLLQFFQMKNFFQKQIQFIKIMRELVLQEGYNLVMECNIR
ncbi:unnamed protein product [Paramecium pentaurelia]|uniref:Uncharacterized protein n=1 Tax=Paramecium pentaurelia TaxID=43138 RepID=A0A8S1YI77_9CILI|nr:unnamed protein product [Paramecium pentaurelia]